MAMGIHVAGRITVAKKLILKQGDETGLSGRTYVITRSLKMEKNRKWEAERWQCEDSADIAGLEDEERGP